MGELSVSNIHFPSHPSLRMYGIRCMRLLLVTLVEMACPSCKRAPALRFKGGQVHSQKGGAHF